MSHTYIYAYIHIEVCVISETAEQQPNNAKRVVVAFDRDLIVKTKGTQETLD